MEFLPDELLEIIIILDNGEQFNSLTQVSKRFNTLTKKCQENITDVKIEKIQSNTETIRISISFGKKSISLKYLVSYFSSFILQLNDNISVKFFNNSFNSSIRFYDTNNSNKDCCLCLDCYCYNTNDSNGCFILGNYKVCQLHTRIQDIVEKSYYHKIIPAIDYFLTCYDFLTHLEKTQYIVESLEELKLVLTNNPILNNQTSIISKIQKAREELKFILNQ